MNVKTHGDTSMSVLQDNRSPSTVVSKFSSEGIYNGSKKVEYEAHNTQREKEPEDGNQASSNPEVTRSDINDAIFVLLRLGYSFKDICEKCSIDKAFLLQIFEELGLRPPSECEYEDFHGGNGNNEKLD